MPDIKSSWKFALEPILKEDKMDYEDNTTSVDQQAEPLEDIRSVKIQRNVVQDVKDNPESPSGSDGPSEKEEEEEGEEKEVAKSSEEEEEQGKEQNKEQMEDETKTDEKEEVKAEKEKKQPKLQEGKKERMFKTITITSDNKSDKNGKDLTNEQDKTQQSPSPARNLASKIVHIRNLVQPFTVNQLKELAKRTGPIVDEKFWIDKIKSHCFIFYENEEDARRTRKALHNTRWPQSNPKTLIVDFGSEEQLKCYKGDRKRIRPPENKTKDLQKEKEKQERWEKRKEEREKEIARRREEREKRNKEREETEKEKPVREWDRGKKSREDWDRTMERSKSRSRSLSEARRSLDRMEREKKKKAAQQKKDDEPPAKLLDDLFKKIKDTPCLNSLPSTEEQVAFLLLPVVAKGKSGTDQPVLRLRPSSEKFSPVKELPVGKDVPVRQPISPQRLQKSSELASLNKELNSYRESLLEREEVAELKAERNNTRTEAPDAFDSYLPDISVDDINQLKEVPELCGILSVPADEELFDGKYKGKDPRQSSKLERLSIPRTLPGNGSDTDIHQNDRKQPYSIEGGSVSLGDQFTECEGDEEIIPKSGFDSLSPPDKEFLLAKSLSDDLTQEMKAGKDSPTGKSGEKIKDITSHSVTIQPKEAVNRIRKPSIKSATDMSPDMETSQEFSTADFYIDESMPSSIESPPKNTSSNDSKTNLEQLLNEEKRSNDKLQTDLKDCYLKLSIYEGDFRTLREVVEEKLPKVKEQVKNFKAAHIDDVEKFQKELEAMKDNLSDIIKQFESRLFSNNKNMIDKLTEKNLLTLKALNEKLEESESKCANLMGENKALHSSIEEINMKQKETLEQLLKEKLESNAKLLAEIQDLNLKHELELEVETDKLKSELKLKVGELEKQIDKCEDEAIKQLNCDKINQEEKLTEIFQREKDKICDILGTEYDEKLFSAIKEENSKHEELREMVKAEMKEIHEKEIERKLEELKQRMLTEREHAIEMTQSTVTLELNKVTDEVKQQLLNEKDAELKMLREQLESKFQEDIAKLSSEFNREKESLVKLVNKIENKGTQNEESQTAISMFQIVHCDTQTDKEPVKVESQVQTDILLQTRSSMQTNLCEQTQFATQTDKMNSIAVSAQTETVILTELAIQTDTMQTNEQFVQTEVDNGVEKQCAQSLELSDFSALTDSKSHGQMSTQTEIVSFQQFSTQTDKLEQNQTMSQTETVSFQKLATQTDRQEQNQSGTQTDADQKVQTFVKDESSESYESPEVSEPAEIIDSLQKKLQLDYDEMSGGKKQLGFAENFALSAAAAIISKIAAAPIERVKLLVQNRDEMLKTGRLDKPYKGVIDCTTRTFRSEGLLPFWRGNLASCIRYFSTQALIFAFKDQVKAMFKSSKNDSYAFKFGKNVFSGGAAGALSLCFVYSLDYCRTRLANDAKSSKKGGEHQYSGMIDVYKKTLASDGVAGLYRDFVFSCVGIIVYRGCYFGFYDTLKPVILGKDGGFLASFALGYIVTISAGLVSYPIDTIRRRMMMTSGEAVKYKGSIDCTVQIVKNEGFMSLMKGAGANILRGVAGAGVLSGFDKLKEFYVAWRLGD